MAVKRVFAVCAGACLVLAAVSCQGRHADATPNGETVDVVVSPAVSDVDTLSCDEAVPDCVTVSCDGDFPDE